MYFNSVTVGHVAMDFFQYTHFLRIKGIGLEIKKYQENINFLDI